MLLKDKMAIDLAKVSKENKKLSVPHLIPKPAKFAERPYSKPIVMISKPIINKPEPVRERFKIESGIKNEIVDMRMNGMAHKDISQALGVPLEQVEWVIDNFKG